MRFLIFIVVVVLLIIGGVWFFGGHVGQWVDDAKESITESSSDSHLIGLSEKAMSQAAQGLKKRYADVYQVSVEVAKLEAKMKAQKEKLSREETIFEKARALLKKHKPGSKIMIGNVPYTWEQVNGDVL